MSPCVYVTKYRLNYHLFFTFSCTLCLPGLKNGQDQISGTILKQHTDLKWMMIIFHPHVHSGCNRSLCPQNKSHWAHLTQHMQKISKPFLCLIVKKNLELTEPDKQRFSQEVVKRSKQQYLYYRAKRWCTGSLCDAVKLRLAGSMQTFKNQTGMKSYKLWRQHAENTRKQHKE